MTDNIPQTSASERIEAARKVLAAYDADPQGRARENAMHDCIGVLRALITPPPTSQGEGEIVRDLLRSYQVTDDVLPLIETALREGVRAGIQSAHLTWEPADHPSQEMMLRWLGIEDVEVNKHGDIYIPEQFIEKEID